MPSKGVKSTEFWITIMSFIGMFANGTSIFNVPWDIYIGFLAANGLYIVGRTGEKMSAHNAKRKETSNAT